MAKSEPQLDVLVLGEHPATYLAAALLKHKTKLRVLHACVPNTQSPDRLVIVNPAIYDLHKLLEPLRRKLKLDGLYGVQFLGDDGATRSEFRSKPALACTGTYKEICSAMMKLAVDEDVELVNPRTLEIHRPDENGMAVTLGKQTVTPRLLMLGAALPIATEKLLGMPEGWGADVVRRYTFLKLKAAKWIEASSRPIMPMSLDLRGMLCWGWLIPFGEQIQLAVEQPVELLSKISPRDLLIHWAEVLRKHGILNATLTLPLDNAESIDLPFAGALVQEGVANRTLLIGPAGGFYSATGEDIYPNCWSAIHAVDVAKKSLKEPHLQDALQNYRHRWRTTLGDYLRGPQQNLRFLLPLIYRNQVMTQRLSESILLGKSVVR